MKIIWTETAKKDLEKLEDETAERIIKKVEDVSDFPEHYLSSMSGHDLHSIRIGDYRAVVKKGQSEISVIAVGHRKNIYRHF